MTIATLLYGLVFASLVALAAASLDSAFRLGGRATRGIWVAALCVTVVGTAAAPLRVSTDASQAVRVSGTASGTVVLARPSFTQRIAQPFVTARRFVANAAERVVAHVPVARSWRFDWWLAASWLAASILLLTLLAAVHAHFARARRAWPKATLDGTDVRLTPRTGPAVIGLLTPEIVVPEWLVSRAAGERQLVLDHEREHLYAHDPLVLTLAWAAAALVPWHPAVWWMLARLRLAVELDCDARVLRRGVAPRRYGALLIDLSAKHPAPIAGVPVLGLTLTNLERRLIAMTPHHRHSTYARRIALAATALVAFVIACDAPVPTSVTGAQAARIMKDSSALSSLANLVAPGDTMVLRVAGMIDGQYEPLTLEVNGAPFIVKDDSIRQHELRKKIEYMVTMNAEKAFKIAADKGASHSKYTFDPSQARREKIMLDKMMAQHNPEQNAKVPFDGLVVIDGKPASRAVLTQVPPQEIQSIDVLEGPTAAAKYADPKAANGVVAVTTKHP